MRTRQLFLILALLCAVVQGAWAQNYDVWDGVTQKQPSITEVGAYNTRIDINSAAEMAWLMAHFDNGMYHCLGYSAKTEKELISVLKNEGKF